MACSAIFQTGESSFPTDEDAVLTARRAHVEVGFEERLADGIALAYGHTQVLTEVLERGPYLPGLDLDLTPALAARLGIDAVTNVRWRFAR